MISHYMFFLFVRFRLDSDSFPWKLSWFRSQNTLFGKPHCSRLRQFCACWVLSQTLSLSRGSYHQQSQGCFTSQLLNCRDEREKSSHLESRGYLVESAKRPPASWWDCVFMEFKRNCASRPMNPLTDLAYHQFQAEGFNVKIIKQICLSDSSGRRKNMPRFQNLGISADSARLRNFLVANVQEKSLQTGTNYVWLSWNMRS